MLQLRHVSTFVAIAEEGTLTAAADRLYKTQGAVSHDLKSLESQFGLQLIDRSGQRIALTPAGAAFLPHARELIRRMNDAELLMRRLKLGEGGVVRVGTLSSLSRLVLGKLVEYGRADQHRSFTLFSEVRSVLVEWLRDGTLDLAIAEPGPEPDLEATPLGDDHLRVVLRRDHELAGRESVTPEDLVDRPFVAFTRELGSSQIAMRFFSSIGRYPTPVMELNDAELMKETIRLGFGYGLMPLSSVAGERDLVAIPPEPHLERRIAVLRSSHRAGSPTATATHDFLATALQLSGTRPR
jgi:DNA-binding transcriptional LysR family regulator